MKRVIDCFEMVCEYVSDQPKKYDVGTGYLAFRTTCSDKWWLCRYCEPEDRNSHCYIEDMENPNQRNQIVILNRNLSSLEECDKLVEGFNRAIVSLYQKVKNKEIVAV